MRTTPMLVIAACLSGCATQFYGAPKVNGGPAGCKATCDAWEMDLVGMVKMGEYSDGCICQVRALLAPRSAAASADPTAPSPDASGPGAGGISGLPAVVGVHLQMQAAAAAAAQQSAANRRATPHGGSPGWPGGHHGRF